MSAIDTPPGETKSVGLYGLWATTTAMMVYALWQVFIQAPEEKVMGAVQKVFYFHVASAMMIYLGVTIMLGGSIAYLWTRRQPFENLSRAATEVALLFTTIVLITGPIWARPAWGTWWTWEARLTTSLVLWVLLVAALMVRRYADEDDLGARLAAVVGIIAAMDVFVIRKAVQWWRGQHPQVFAPNQPQGLAPEMQGPFLAAIVASLLLFCLLLWLRVRTLSLEQRLAACVERLDERNYR